MSPLRNVPFMLTVLATPMIAGSLAEYAIEAKEDSNEPNVGARVLLSNGQRMHVRVTGPEDSSGPTIVFEAGSSETLLIWEHLINVLCPNIRCISYSRAGLGLSDPAKTPRTDFWSLIMPSGSAKRSASAVADDLRDVLRTLKVTGDVVAVGYGSGTLFARELARRNLADARAGAPKREDPFTVAGLVLLDPVVEGVDEQIAAKFEMAAMALNKAQSAAQSMATMAFFGGLRFGVVFNKQAQAQAVLLYGDGAQDALFSSSRFAHRLTSMAELQNLYQVEKDVCQGNRELAPASLPVVVLSRGLNNHYRGLADRKNSGVDRNEAEQLSLLRVRAQAALATSLSNSTGVFARLKPSSGFMMCQFPEEVAAVVRAVADVAGSKGTQGELLSRLQSLDYLDRNVP